MCGLPVHSFRMILVSSNNLLKVETMFLQNSLWVRIPDTFCIRVRVCYGRLSYREISMELPSVGMETEATSAADRSSI